MTHLNKKLLWLIPSTDDLHNEYTTELTKIFLPRKNKRYPNGKVILLSELFHIIQEYTGPHEAWIIPREWVDRYVPYHAVLSQNQTSAFSIVNMKYTFSSTSRSNQNLTVSCKYNVIEIKRTLKNSNCNCQCDLTNSNITPISCSCNGTRRHSLMKENDIDVRNDEDWRAAFEGNKDKIKSAILVWSVGNPIDTTTDLTPYFHAITENKKFYYLRSKINS
jgi:hypothetical protein